MSRSGNSARITARVEGGADQRRACTVRGGCGPNAFVESAAGGFGAVAGNLSANVDGNGRSDLLPDGGGMRATSVGGDKDRATGRVNVSGEVLFDVGLTGKKGVGKRMNVCEKE